MLSRVLAATTTACLLAMPSTGVAQSSPVQVTFQVPLNLKELSTDITKVMVACAVMQDLGEARISTWGGEDKSDELSVSGGQISTTVTVVVTVDGSDKIVVGTRANYSCHLTGFSTSLQKWSAFSAAPEAAPFRLIPTPQDIHGYFDW